MPPTTTPIPVTTSQPAPTSPSVQTFYPQCPSACSKDSIFSHSAETADSPEISIPENVDGIELSTAAAPKSLTDKVSELIDNASLQRNQSTENASTINETIETTTINAYKAIKSTAIDGERPIEVRDSSTSIVSDPLPTLASAAGTVSIASLLLQPFPLASNSNSVYHMTKEPSPSNEDYKLEKVEATILLSDTHSTAVLAAVDSTVAMAASASNDINGVYNKKIQPSSFEILTDDQNKNESAEVAPMLTGPAAVPAESDCFFVRLIARADSFNVTLGSDDICPHSDGGGHSFNITYNIPISQYMKENRFDLIFV